MDKKKVAASVKSGTEEVEQMSDGFASEGEYSRNQGEESKVQKNEYEDEMERSRDGQGEQGRQEVDGGDEGQTGQPDVGPRDRSESTAGLELGSTQGRPRRGPWSAEEDKRLLGLISVLGASNWVRISNALMSRTPKQCRERYHQNLKPSLNRSPITAEEGILIEKLVAKYGKKWAEIARHLNGRSDNAVKNWWNGGANRRRRHSVQISKFENESQYNGSFQNAHQGAQFHMLPQPGNNSYSHSQPHQAAPPVGHVQHSSVGVPQGPYHHSTSQFTQIAFNTSMFGNSDRGPTLQASQTNSNTLPPFRPPNNRLISFDIYNNPLPGAQNGQNTQINQNFQTALFPSLNNINTSLPSLMLPTKRRLLDEYNPMGRRHTYANNVYTPGAASGNSTNSYTNLSKLSNGNTVRQSVSLSNSGHTTPHNVSPLMTTNSSRQDSISTFELPPFGGSGNTSLIGTRRSSLNPEYFSGPSKDMNPQCHQRNISQHSFNSPSITPSGRFSFSGASSGGQIDNQTNTFSQTAVPLRIHDSVILGPSENKIHSRSNTKLSTDKSNLQIQSSAMTSSGISPAHQILDSKNYNREKNDSGACQGKQKVHSKLDLATGEKDKISVSSLID